MRFAITGTDARFLPLRKLLLADGHEITDPASADMVISPPWDPSARYARREEYQIAIARLTAEQFHVTQRGDEFLYQTVTVVHHEHDSGTSTDSDGFSGSDGSY